MSIIYLVDTNILVQLVRSDRVGQQIQSTYTPTMLDPRPLMSIVTEGESYFPPS